MAGRAKGEPCVHAAPSMVLSTLKGCVHRILFFRNCLPNRELTFPRLDFFQLCRDMPTVSFPVTFRGHICTPYLCLHTKLLSHTFVSLWVCVLLLHTFVSLWVCVWRGAISSEEVLPFWEESGLKVKYVCGSENQCHESQPRLERKEETSRRTL